MEDLVGNGVWSEMEYIKYMAYDIIHKVQCKWMKLRLQPIRVFCLHHVCGAFDAESMNKGDWLQTDEFKSKVLNMQRDGVVFVSLTEAYRHICSDWIRCKKYAVITLDDGYVSLKEILPWLEEKHIPATLFINGKYLDGQSFRRNPKERYLTKKELWGLNSPFIEVANHGWEHIRVTDMKEGEFRTSVEQNVQLLSTHPNYIPFWAYTYGTHTDFTDSYLSEQYIIPVYVDGVKNYKEKKVIHRELLK